MDPIKKILVIITTKMAPYDGLTTVAMNYYRYLDHGMFHMDFASTNDIDSGISEELKENKSEYIKLPGRGSLSYMPTLYILLKGYDIVHVHGNSATTTLELLPAIFARISRRMVHIHSTACLHMTMHRVLKPIFDKCYTHAIACSKAAGDWIFTRGDHTVLNNAIDLDRYRYDSGKRERIRRQYGLREDSFVVGHVGRLSEEKNHIFLLDVFKEVLKIENGAKLMLVGDGELRQKLEMRADQLGIRASLIFCGMQDSAGDFFSAFDRFVFPSFREGMSLALLEAQANGLDCVISDAISPEADTSEGIQRLPFTKGVAVWARAITAIDQENRDIRSERYRKSLREHGYDIKKNVSALEYLYLH